MGASDETLRSLARTFDLPIAWFRVGDAFAVVIDGCVLRQDSELHSFYVYFSSFTIFDVSWIHRAVKVIHNFN